MRALQVLRVAAFGAALVFPLLTMGRVEGALASEQRPRLPRPAFRVAGTQYPEQFDAYFRDNFGWRDRLIRWHNLLKFRLLGQSPVAHVIVGKEGWLFYGANGDGVDMRDFAGRWPYRLADLDAWLRHMDYRAQEYAQQGARYLVAVAPNKQTIYPELVPERYGPHAPGLINVFFQRLRTFRQLEVVDLRQALRAHKAQGPLYFRGDSHWNAKGAFYAAQAITDRVRAALPGVGVLREEDYTILAAPMDGGDLVRMLALDIKLPDQVFEYQRRTPGARLIRNEQLHRVWEQADPRLPRAVLLGDSYGGALAPLLADSFSRLYYYVSSHGGPDPSIVQKEKPDVVILVNVERYLGHLGIQ